MKAVVKAPIGKGVEVVDEPYPELKPGYVIIKIKAAGICGTDLHTIEGANHPQSQTALLRPLGHEGSGEIVEIAKDVADCRIGDRVTYNPFTSRTRGFCGTCEHCQRGDPLGCSQRHLMSQGGTMAEYAAIRADALYRLPPNLSYEEGALIEPFAVGVSAVHEIAALKPGRSLTILGPGPIGLCVLLAAKLLNPSLAIVTGLTVDKSPRLELASSLGADVIINAEEEDPIQRVMEATKGGGVDMVFEAIGVPLVQQGLKMLKYRGRFIGIGHPAWADASVQPSILFTGEDYLNMQHKRLSLTGHWVYDTQTWDKTIRLLAAGSVNLKPLASHRIPLREAEKGFELALQKRCVKALLIP